MGGPALSDLGPRLLPADIQAVACSEAFRHSISGENCTMVDMILGQLVSSSGKDPRVTKPQDPALLRRLLRAKDSMDAASHEDWPVHRLASVSGVSTAHFARSFRQAFGVPPHRYLLTRRLERAKALLRDTNLAITAIAFDTGWTSLGTFGRIFRAVTGESPSECRTRAQRQTEGLGRVPACYLSAAQRPDLTRAVSEKRRHAFSDRLAERCGGEIA